MLNITHATVRFGTTLALDGASLTLPAGDTMALLGPSGSGKTTLLRAIAGLQTLDGGSVTWNGDDVTAVPPHRRRFGLVFQDFALFPHLDCGRNVAFGLRMAGVAPDERRRRVAEALERVDLGGYERRPVSSLSGGQAQRVALARALVVEPRMLLLDEPFGALDVELRQRLALELRSLLDRLEITALHVTHDQDEAFAVADTVAVLMNGRILQVAQPTELWSSPVSEAVARFLGLRTIVDASVHGGVATTPLGPISLPGAGDDRAARLVIRPEAVSISSSGTRAIVRTITFRGGVWAVELDAGGLRIDALVPSPPAVGNTVHIAIDPAGVSVVQPEGPDGGG